MAAAAPTPAAPPVSNMVACVNFIAERVTASLESPAKAKSARFMASLNEDANRIVTEEWIKEPDQPFLIFFWAGPDKVTAATTIPRSMGKKKGVYFLKSKNVVDSLKIDDLKTEVVCSELTEQGLSNLALLAQEIYYPLLSNPANRSGWSGPTSKELMLKFSNFLSKLTMTVGQSKGQTLLPNPPPEAFDEENIPDRERIYLLETAVVEWTDKIKEVLSADPETLSKLGGFPDPLVEIEFWAAKASDLTSLSEQLNSDRIRIVRDQLLEIKNTYGTELETLTSRVAEAREEAADNTKFLRTLKASFRTLRNELDFLKLESIFTPMLHTMLLVWQHSHHYNKRARLVTLVQEICNGLIAQAQKHCQQKKIFEVIELGDVDEAIKLVTKTIAVCEKFKATFFIYAEKAAKLLPEGAWDVPKEILFVRLDAFLERCQDVLEFVKIVMEFSRLEKIFIGGTKGKSLTEMLHVLHADFQRSYEQFQPQRLPYDIMDITVSQFDDDFYQYRCQVKEMERRLAAVVIQAFDDSSTMTQRFKLLDAFEGLLERPIVKDELDKRQNMLLTTYNGDLMACQALFLEGTTTSGPKIDSNLPPTAGSLAWCRGLLDRVREPFHKLRHFVVGGSGGHRDTMTGGFGMGAAAHSRHGSLSFETKESKLGDTDELIDGKVTRIEMKEVERLHDAIVKQLEDYEKKKIGEWAKEIDATSEDKLLLPLLRRESKDSRRLVVNFDDALVRLLREVKYFLQLRLAVPPTAVKIYQKGDKYRQQMGTLDMMVKMYNEMMDTLHPVERPLVEKDVAHIDDTLERGITALNWTMTDAVDAFIKEAMDTTKEVYATVKVMKDNLGATRKMMEEYASQPLAERKNKPLSPSDFEDNLKKLWATRHLVIAENQKKVTELLNQTLTQLKVNKGSPIWRAYVEYVQDQIRDGLALTITNSIKFLCDQLADQQSMEKNGMSTLLEIKIGLYANEVLFNAEDVQPSTNLLGATPPVAGATAGSEEKAVALAVAAATMVSAPRKSRRDVWQIVADWAEAMFEIGNIMTRMDGSHYVGDLKKNEPIMRYINVLKKLLDGNQRECELYRAEYTKYDFLWKTDRNTEFNRFLQTARTQAADERKRADEKEEEKKRGKKLGGNAPAATPGGAATDRKDGKDNKTPRTARGGAGAGADDDDADMKDEEDPNAGAADILPLDKFEAKILSLRELAKEINGKPASQEIGWLKVNALPIKESLKTWVARWIKTYTDYLYNDVTHKLNDMEQLQKEVNENITDDVQGDSVRLKKVLGYIHKVKSADKSTKKMFGPMRECVALLKKYGRNLSEPELRLLAEAQRKWDETVDKVYQVKETVNSLQNEEVSNIRQKVTSFDTELKAFRKDFRNHAPFSYDLEVDEAYDLIMDFHRKINKMEEKSARLNDLEKVFELTVSKHTQIKKSRHENKLLKQVWDMVSIVKHQFDDWKKTLWDKIDADSLELNCNKLLLQMEEMSTEIRSWAVFLGLQADVKNFKTVAPLVTRLRSDAMEERHWRDLKSLTGKQFNKDASFCLANLLELELHKYVSDVEYIVDQAQKEAKIGAQLRQIEANWSNFRLEFGTRTQSIIGDISTSAESKGNALAPQMRPSGSAATLEVRETIVGTIRRPDEILTKLEENQAALQGIQGQGKTVDYFIDDVKKWQKILGTTETVLYDWLEVQSKWSALQAIFMGSQDIRIQLPVDAQRFMDIDAKWKELMTIAKETPNVIEACVWKGRSELLGTMKIGLEQCEKSLNQYLETKRKAFPRFYFLPNTALLDILSNGHDPQKVQRYLGDCFDNINALEFKETADGVPTKTAIKMVAKEGDEKVDFYQPLECKGAVEDWLNQLVVTMRETLSDILGRAKYTADHWEPMGGQPRHKWLFQYPAQIALTASQIVWSEEINSQFEAFQDGNEQAMKEEAKTLQTRLDNLIQLVLGTLTAGERTKVITMITVDVHNLAIVQKLIEQKVYDPNSFLWQSQMRFKWKSEARDCQIRIADAQFSYSYEYIGNTSRLVITPLTDRCYITLTQALRLIMGGAPAGPAGTGKTETTKDLGRALGLPVYVFNCSELMNVQYLSAVFRGICQTGAWACFDEFNRIQVEVLSVVSMQVACLLNAQREKREEFDFQGEMIKLVPSAGVFITMNPGYAGRTQLPENLKALFRSCAMVVPDMELICENMLMSEGFLLGNKLSKKFTTLYSLSSELLSKQIHYDWGLRATKAVLVVAGSLKRAEPSSVPEERILMRALRDFNIPKLVDEDKPIFRQLIEDLFPGHAHAERKVDPKLQEAIQLMARQGARPDPTGRDELDGYPESKWKLQAEDTFVLKCVELAELLEIRHSVFIIGPAGSGKSEIWKTLVSAFRHMGRDTVYEVVNPKAVNNSELFGYLSKTDWHDGILSTVMRNMSRNNPPYTPQHKYKWVVLDGDIDPDWIESLNSVMDDNKMLTLVSNERIPLTKEMRLVFEIDNLANATPATVSRAGIIFINAKDIGWKPFHESWIESRKDEKEKSFLLSLFNRYVESLTEIRGSFKTIVPVSEINIIRTLCYLLEGLLAKQAELKKKGKPEDRPEPAMEKDVFEANFVFAVIWALGGALMADKQHPYRNEFSERWKDVPSPIKFPKEGTVFDYYPNPKTGKMVPWASVVPAYEPPADAHLVTKAFVPTVDTVRMRYLLDLLVSQGKPVLLVGSAGTGKTTLVHEFLGGLGDGFMHTTINLNYYTNPKTLQRIMEGNIDKRVGRTYGPAGHKKLIYYIDDLNMPRLDKYGTQTPLALIRQHMDYGSWYDTSKLEKKEIQDVQYVASMNPTAGSFTINERLQGKFATFAVLLPSQADLHAIYGAVMDHHFGQGAGAYPKDVLAMKDLLVKATVEVLDAIVTSPQFRPDSKRFHYLFNLRDLSSIFQGLCQIQPGKGFDPKTIVRLWEHECTRTFADRLVKKQEVAKFDELLTIKTKNFFGGSVKLETKSIDDNRELKVGERDDGPLLFTSFMSGRAYLPVGTMDKLRRVLQTRLKEYNATLPVMNLELFGVAMEHVCRIVRIIENPRGNALLVGVGGSGKQSLARLASFICGYSTFQISVTQTYGVQQLKEDLQTLYRKAGEKNMPVCFLLTESQIIDDEWLVYVNDLLASGHIPDLFTPEEKDGIFAHIRNEARQFGVPDTREAMHDFFIGRVRTNLHMILCFSPVPREAFRVRCRKFPGLINCTTMDWFHPWPRDALVSVASRFLSEIDVGDNNASMAISEFLASTHLSVNQASVQYKAVERRYNYTTPKSFLALIEFFKSFLAKKRTDLTKQVDRLEKGILTLKQTHSKVADLKEELDKARERAREKGDKVAETLTQLNLQQKKVTDEQQKAAVEAGNAKRASDAATIIREECDKELAAAMPLLEKAKDAVNCLDKPSLNEMRTLGSPPPPVVAVARAVMTLINYPDKKRDWNCAKTKLLAVTERFIDDLRVFDATKIDESTMKKMDEFLGEPWFSVEGFTASRAGANLCGWVVNICAYNRIYQRTKPKMENQAKANAEYESAHARLMGAEAKVEEKQKQLRAKQAELDSANAEKKQLDDEAKNCDDRLTLAKRLVVGLAEENTRWTKGVLELKEKGRTMTGDVLLASAFVSYVGAFSQVFRRQLVDKKWIPDLLERKIPLTAGVDPLRVLATLSDFAKWKNEDLADDPMSLQNAAIITQCTRWPLFIDPQLQGTKWLRKRIRGIKTVQLSQKRWLSVLRDAIINGDVVLIENLGEELDATLDPVLARSTVQRGSEKFIKIGSDEVVYNDNFKLFLQTKLANPHYKPEVAAQCTIVNFIVTEEGLEEQLLEKVVNKEKPDLEEKRGHAVHAINEYMVNLVDLENDLLERLSNAPPDILGDEELIIGLENTKKTATDIEAKVASLRVQEVSINASRNDFRPVAAEGSWLYFLLSQLNSIDHMYQYSLDAFSGFFIKAMARAKKADNVKERVSNLRESIRYTVFTWVNRGLFEKHKLIFSSQLCFKLMAKDALKEKLNASHFEFLIRGEPKKGGPEKPLEWLPSQAWWQIQRLIELDGFQKLASDMVASPNRFKEWYNKPRPESSPLPLEWRKLDESNPFMKLLIVKAMRLDRMTTAMENYVRDSLPNGKSYTEVDAGRGFVEILSAALDDSTKINPIFFILSPGADPIHNVEFLAKRNGFSEGKFHRVAMGQGQETNALNRLDIASKDGHWVVLENIHLMPKWVFELEKKLDEFESAAATGGSHEDFRVFLSAEPSDTIPIGLLERSIKLTNEPPQGLKQNLKRAFNTFDKDDFEFKDPKMKSIIFGLCHFHSIIIERIKFGAKGWNRVYPFGTGDLMCSVTVLSNYLENATGDKIPWNDLKYIFGEIIYGGHITDDWDRLLCSTYLRWYMREDLLDEMELYPFNESTPEEKFRSPPPLPYDQYNDYIESQMQPESPIAFGLHPNAEISVKTKQAEELFHRIVDLQPRSGVAASESKAQTQRVIGLVSQIRERTKPIRYGMDELATQCIGPDDRRGSYQNVFLQECDRMNRLVEEIQRSLNELDQGLSGELQISEKMVLLHQALDLGRVPATWTKLAYPSERALGAWVDNLIARADQLNNWVSDPIRVPPWVNLAYLFNPQSFLTAIMQETAQEQKLELDKLVIATEVTRKTTDQISESRPKDGSAYVTGLYLEGARWNWTTGQLEECNPRELFCPLPVMVCRAIPVDKQEKGGQYRCPVYKTQSRGNTYVFTANLRSPKLPASKWILAGVALVMEVEDI